VEHTEKSKTRRHRGAKGQRHRVISKAGKLHHEGQEGIEEGQSG